MPNDRQHQRMNEAVVVQRLAHVLLENAQGAENVVITNPDSFTVTFPGGERFAVFVKQIGEPSSTGQA